jgi:hypothetical protein
MLITDINLRALIRSVLFSYVFLSAILTNQLAVADALDCESIKNKLQPLCENVSIAEKRPDLNRCRFRCVAPNVSPQENNFLLVQFRNFKNREQSQFDFEEASKEFKKRDPQLFQISELHGKKYFAPTQGNSIVILDGIRSILVVLPNVLNLTPTARLDFRNQALSLLIKPTDGCCPAGAVGPDLLGSISCQKTCGCQSCETMNNFGKCETAICN